MTAMRDAGSQSAYKLYNDLADWWPLLSRPEDYDIDAECVWSLLTRASDKSHEGAPYAPQTVLELGSGGGNTASHLKKHCKLTLIDLSQEMLDVSARLNPECEHIQGEMRTVRLGQTFDAVYIHDAIMYLTRQDDVRAAIETVVHHCKPGGVVAFLPDFVQETFRESTHLGGHDGDGRSLRYFTWDIDHDPNDNQYTVYFAYMLRDRDGRVRHDNEQHQHGLFPRAAWIDMIQRAGCRVFSAIGPGKNEVFGGVKNP